MIKNLINYLISDLNLKPEAATSIVLTLFTFLCGFLITWLAGYFVVWKKRRNYRKSLKTIITHFLSSCQKQFILFEAFPKQKGYLFATDYQMDFAANPSIHYLSKLDISKFIENFSTAFHPKRSAEISDMLNIFERVSSSMQQLKKELEFAYKFYSDHLDDYNSNLRGLTKIHDDLVYAYHDKIIDKELAAYLKCIFDIYSTWNNNGKNTMLDTTSREIVEPLLTNAKLPPPRDLSAKIIEHCLNCQYAIAGITNIEKFMRTQVANSLEIHKNGFIDGTAILKKW